MLTLNKREKDKNGSNGITEYFSKSLPKMVSLNKRKKDKMVVMAQQKTNSYFFTVI